MNVPPTNNKAPEIKTRIQDPRFLLLIVPIRENYE